MKHNTINYIEFPAKDIARIKEFYSKTFGWTFVDYGPDYASFENAGIDGGFTTGTKGNAGLPLIVLYSANLTETLEAIKNNGGTILQDIYEFPGGKRFHFADPDGNELAVWSE